MAAGGSSGPSPTTSYDSTIIAETSLLAYWPMEELSGTTMYDVSGNGMTGSYTATGVTLGQTGVGDGMTAVAFDGASGAASTPAFSVLGTTDPVTLEFWADFAAGGGVQVVVEYSADFNTTGSFIVAYNADVPNAVEVAVHGNGSGGGTGYAFESYPISTGVLHHYMILFGQQASVVPFAFMLDGVSVTATQYLGYSGPATTGGPGFTNSPNSPLYFAARDASMYFTKGTLAKVAIYSGDQTGRAAAHYAAAVPSAYDTAVLADTPVAFWPLNELAGTKSRDTTGNGHTGTYTGGVTLNQTGIGDGAPAVLLNGSSGYVTTPHAAALCPSSGSTFTIEGWVNVSLLRDYEILYGTYDGSDGCNFGVHSGGKLYFGTASGVFDSTGTISAGAYHHLVATYSSGTVTFYIDGSSAGTASPGAWNAGSLEIVLGNDHRLAGGNFLSGDLAKIAFYSVALSAGQVAAHYAAA